MALSLGRLVTSIISPCEGRETQISQRQNSPSGYTLGNPRVNHACAPRCIKRGKIFPTVRSEGEFRLWAIWVSLPCTGTYYTRHQAPLAQTTFPKNYVYVLRTTKTLHMVSFIEFYFHFPANFQALTSPHMFSIIYLCYVTCHTQWAWVTYTPYSKMAAVSDELGRVAWKRGIEGQTPLFKNAVKVIP